MDVSGQIAYPVFCPPGREQGTNLIGGWAEFGFGLDIVPKRRILTFSRTEPACLTPVSTVTHRLAMIALIRTMYALNIMSVFCDSVDAIM
jgi:hypothetical protein